MMQWRLSLLGGLMVLGGVALMGQPSNAASSDTRHRTGQTGFSEVYVPQAEGRVRAQPAANAKALSPKSLPEGRAVNANGTTAPVTCGPENANSAACRNTAAQQSHR